MLDALHARHIANLRRMTVSIDEVGMLLGGRYIMFFAEVGLMSRHARLVTEGICSPDVLEIGLGLGIFAEQLSREDLGSYTVVEPSREVISKTWDRVVAALGVPTELREEAWQSARFEPETYDSIMYDTVPPEGQADRDFGIFVEEVALRVLRPGGRLTFFSPGKQVSPARADILNAAFDSWTADSYSIPPEVVPPGWTLGTRDFRVPVAVKG